MGNKLALGAVVLALLALLAALLLRGGERTLEAARRDESELAPLLERIAGLEAECLALRRALDDARLSPTAAPPRESLLGSDPRLVELLERVSALEQERPEIEPELVEEALRRRTEDQRRTREQDRLQAAERAVTAVRDANASEATLLESLRTLRGVRLPDGSDARLQVLEEMIALAGRSSAGETRADVWRQLSHVTDERLRRPLLDALIYDEHARAREEAAETLADFLPDTEVEAALRSAASADADPGVRGQAAESLREGSERSR